MGKLRIAAVSKAPVEKLYAMGHDPEIFPRVCPNLVGMRVINRSDDRSFVKAEWTAKAKVIALSRTIVWIQEDRWDDDVKCCRFSLSPDYKGNFKKMQGTWVFKPHGNGTQMVMDVDFQIDHPLVSPGVHRFLDGIMQKNNECLLQGLAKLAEKG